MERELAYTLSVARQEMVVDKSIRSYDLPAASQAYR